MIYLIQNYKQTNPKYSYEIALDLVAKAIRYGIVLYSPIYNNYSIGLLHIDLFEEDYTKCNLQILKKCNSAFYLKEIEESYIEQRVQIELNFCRDYNIPVNTFTLKQLIIKIQNVTKDAVEHDN